MTTEVDSLHIHDAGLINKGSPGGNDTEDFICCKGRYQNGEQNPVVKYRQPSPGKAKRAAWPYFRFPNTFFNPLDNAYNLNFTWYVY